MGLRVVTVLRTGGDFRAKHVVALARQVERWLPGAEFVCLTDSKDLRAVATRPFTYLWPGWWAKLNLFCPEIEGDLLYIDLDTVIVGPLDDIAAVGKLTVLSDFMRLYRSASGLMYLPEDSRGEVWDKWMTNPGEFMNGVHGDQGFLDPLWRDKAQRWQDVLPGQVVSYKEHVRKQGAVPTKARVVAFHGKPRPWHLAPEHELYKAAGY